MKLRFLVCAVSAIVDEATKNVSITSILEQLASPIFPAAIPISVVANFVRQASEPDSADIRLSFKIDDQPLMDQPVTIQFQGNLGTRLIAQINPLIVPQPGRLIAEIRAKKKKLGDWEIDVKKAGNEMLLSNLPATAGASERAAKKARKKAVAKKKKSKAKK